MDLLQCDKRFVKYPYEGGRVAQVEVISPVSVKDPPETTVIIPTVDRERGGYFQQLLEQLQQQTYQDFETIILTGDDRQGRAINTGAALARGEIFVILDDDTRLGCPEVLEWLTTAIREHPEIGMAGVANTVPDDAPWLVRRVMIEVPRRSSPVVMGITESDLAEHPCCAIPRRIFLQIGGENEIIPRGLDPYLRREIRRAGYRVVVIPSAYVHHLPPETFSRTLRQFFRNGRQSAFCTRHYPEWVVELAAEHGKAVPESSMPILQRVVRMAWRLITALVTGRFILFVTSVAYMTGFIWGMVRDEKGETRRQGDEETRRQGDKGTGGQEDRETRRQKTEEKGIAIFWVNDFPPITSGIATFFANVCRCLPAERFRVIAPRVPGSEEYDRGCGFTVERINLPLGEDQWSKVKKTLMTMTRAVIVDAKEGRKRQLTFHCSQILSSGLAGLVCKWLFGIPYIVYVYGSETMRLGRGWVGRGLMKRILAKSERVVTNSEATSREFEAFGVPKNKLRRIYPGVDPARFRPGWPDQTLVRRYTLEGKKVLLTVARLDQRKGQDTVMRAMACEGERLKETVYLIVGKGREEERLKKLSKELGLDDRVVFAGYVEDKELPEYYRLCDLCVIPNRVTEGTPLAGDIEGFGIAFIEAAACGKPAIGGRSGGAVEAVLDGETGLLVDPSSVEEIASALIRLLSDDELRKRFGRSGRERVERMFDWEIIAQEVEEILLTRDYETD